MPPAAVSLRRREDGPDQLPPGPPRAGDEPELHRGRAGLRADRIEPDSDPEDRSRTEQDGSGLHPATGRWRGDHVHAHPDAAARDGGGDVEGHLDVFAGPIHQRHGQSSRARIVRQLRERLDEKGGGVARPPESEGTAHPAALAHDRPLSGEQQVRRTTERRPGLVVDGAGERRPLGKRTREIVEQVVHGLEDHVRRPSARREGEEARQAGRAPAAHLHSASSRPQRSRRNRSVTSRSSGSQTLLSARKRSIRSSP